MPASTFFPRGLVYAHSSLKCTASWWCGHFSILVCIGPLAVLADCQQRQAQAYATKAPPVNTAYVAENAEGSGDDEVYTPCRPKRNGVAAGEEQCCVQ